MTTGTSPDEMEDQAHHDPTKLSNCPGESIHENQCKPEITPCREEQHDTENQSKPVITPCREEQHHTPKATEAKAKRGWHRSRNPHSEFQWRGEFLIDEESNWRGTWILEVNDLGALDWEIEHVPEARGCGGPYVRKTTRQWPFPADEARPVEGGQDDLMVYLGRP